MATLSPAARTEAAHRLRQQVLSWPRFLQSRRVLLTASLPDEIDLTPLIDDARSRGLPFALPSFDPISGSYLARVWDRPAAQLVRGAHGVREPGPECPEVPWSELDLILVPGVAFSETGDRLGRGKGYFDRLLRRAPGAVACGVCFDEQVVPALPVEPHDVTLDHLLTPSRRLDCRTAR